MQPWSSARFDQAAAHVVAGGGGGGGAPLDSYTTGLTGAWSMGRKLLTAYGGGFYTTDTGVDALLDQSGLGGTRNLIQPITVSQPAVTTAGTNSRACARLDGGTDYLAGAAISNFIDADKGYIVASVIFRALNTSAATLYQNDTVFCDSTDYMGVFHHNSDGFAAYNYDGTDDYTTPKTSLSTDTKYVVEWIHEGGTLTHRVNGVTTGTVSSGNTDSILGLLVFGRNGSSVYTQLDLFEAAAWDTVPGSGARDAIVSSFSTWVG